MVRRLLFGLMLLLPGCWEHPYAYCTVEKYCHDDDLNPGRCLTTPQGPFCALPDRSCPTGFRWHVFARGELAETCVDPSVPLDAGIDATTDQLIAGG